MRLPWKSSFLLVVVAALLLGQGGTPLENPRVRALGDQLLCMCGCGSSVTSCNMLHCHFSDPARQKLLAMVNAGDSDQVILASFVQQYGPQILLKPPAEGFNLLGWVMPFVAIAVGLAALWWFIQRFRKPLPAGPEPDPATLARVEKDLEHFE